MAASERPPRDAFTTIVAGVGASVIGALFYNVLPLYLGLAQDVKGLSSRQIGLIGTVFFAGWTLTSAATFVWIRRMSWRWTSLGAIPIAAVGLVAGALGQSFVLLLAGMFVAGCALSTVYGVGTTVLADTRNPARWYGVKIAAEGLCGAVLLFGLPGTLVAWWGFPGLVISLVGVLVLLAPLLLLLPASTPAAESTDAASGRTGRSGVWLALVGCTLFMCGETVVWAFVERIGADAGFDPIAVGRLLGVTLLFALGGSFLAAILGGRSATLSPLVAAHVCFLLGLAALYRADLFAAYAAGSCLVMLSVGLGLPFAVTAAAEADPDGRHVVLTVLAIGIGLMLGPGIAGLLVEGRGYGSVLAFAALAMGLGLVAFAVATGPRRRQATSPGGERDQPVPSPRQEVERP